MSTRSFQVRSRRRALDSLPCISVGRARISRISCTIRLVRRHPIQLGPIRSSCNASADFPTAEAPRISHHDRLNSNVVAWDRSRPGGHGPQIGNPTTSERQEVGGDIGIGSVEYFGQ